METDKILSAVLMAGSVTLRFITCSTSNMFFFSWQQLADGNMQRSQECTKCLYNSLLFRLTVHVSTICLNLWTSWNHLSWCIYIYQVFDYCSRVSLVSPPILPSYQVLGLAKGIPHLLSTKNNNVAAVEEYIFCFLGLKTYDNFTLLLMLYMKSSSRNIGSWNFYRVVDLVSVAGVFQLNP